MGKVKLQRRAAQLRLPIHSNVDPGVNAYDYVKSEIQPSAFCSRMNAHIAKLDGKRRKTPSPIADHRSALAFMRCQGERHQAIVETPFIFMSTRHLVLTVCKYSFKQSTGTSREKHSIFSYRGSPASHISDSNGIPGQIFAARTATISGLIAGLGGWYGTE